MEEPKSDGSALPIMPPREPANPELASVKRLLTLLDKTSKSSRTYGAANPVAQKFFQQLFEGLTAHLATYTRLAFLVQRSELYFNGEVVTDPNRNQVMKVSHSSSMRMAFGNSHSSKVSPLKTSHSCLIHCGTVSTPRKTMTDRNSFMVQEPLYHHHSHRRRSRQSLDRWRGHLHSLLAG